MTRPTVPMPLGTFLVLDDIGVPLYSARGITQTLKPIDAAKQFDRTINFEMVDLSEAGSHLYASTISGKDVSPPSFDAVWPGRIVTVDCVCELSYAIDGMPSRDVVPDSEIDEIYFTRYFPRLRMMVVDLSVGAEEWTAGKPWQLDLEEVGDTVTGLTS